MKSIILAHHKDDVERAKEIEEELKNKNFKVYLDSNPFDDNLWDGGWSKKFPGSIHCNAIILITENLSNYLNKINKSSEPYNLETKITYSEASVNIMPVIIDNIDPPSFFIGQWSINSYGHSAEKICENIMDYVDFIDHKTSSSFKKNLLKVSLLLLAMSLSIYLLILNAGDREILKNTLPPILMMSLGALGSVTYILFNTLGLVDDERFSIKAKVENYLRIILGAIMGFTAYAVLFDISSPTSTTSLVTAVTQQSENLKNSLATVIIISFLSGFSARLVIGVINQGVRWVENIVGIPDESKFVLSSRNREKSTDSNQ